MAKSENKVSEVTKAKLSRAAKEQGHTSQGKFATKRQRAPKVPAAIKADVVKKAPSGIEEVDLNKLAQLVASYTEASYGVSQTNPEKLHDMAIHGSQSIRRAIASNPNTSEETLHYILDVAIKGNDAEPLSRIADRGNLSYAIQEKLLFNNLVLNQPNRSTVALIGNANINSEELLLKLAEDSQLTRVGREDMLVSLLVPKEDRWMYKYDFVGTYLAKNPNTNSETLDLVAKSKIYQVRIRVLEHKNTSNTTLEYLAENGSHRYERNKAKYLLDIRNGKKSKFMDPIRAKHYRRWLD